MRRHTSTLYTHPEQESLDDEAPEQWGSPHPTPYSGPPLSSSSRYRLPARAQHSALGTTNPSHSGEGLYNRFVRTYRSGGRTDDARNDPDSHYFQRGLGQLVDAGDSDDESFRVPSGSVGVEESLHILQEPISILPATQEEKERLEWQSLLASVLSGQVLRSEKSRMKEAMERYSEGQNNFRVNLWLGIRARIHSRTVVDERRRIDELRASIVPQLVVDICSFHISSETDDKQGALAQVQAILRRLDVAHSLYPSLKAFYADNPSATEKDFAKRCDALHTWSTVLTTAQQQISVLQRWTGSDTLDVTQPFTSGEIPIGSTSRPTKEDGTEIADSSSFVDRLMKEESMQRTFEKGFLTTVHSFIGVARDAQVNLAGLFEEMNLPSFSDELVPLISFPTKIAQATLRIRLEYVSKLKDPEVLIIDQVTEDIKLGIGLACTLKRQYEAFLAPDPGGKWVLPQSISSDYDTTIHQALIVLFRLLHWKLKSGVKAIYFKETEVLEAPWPTFNDVSATTVGGSRLVAEQLCGLANKLIIRVSNYFETQLKVPASYRIISENRQPNQRSMSNDDLNNWYTKILDSVRLRYRKLQRFARMLSQRFSNSAEYNIENVPLDVFISTLVSTGHFLVYTRYFEEDGTYIIASSGLHDQPEAIRRTVTEAFLGDDVAGQFGFGNGNADSDDEVDDEEEGQYILLLSPRSQFLWNGQVYVLEVPPLELDLKDNRVRLVADGPHRRLALAKQTFTSLFYPEDEEDEDSLSSGIGPLNCLSEQQAHLPSVARELRRITRATNKLAESIVESVHRIRNVLRGSEGHQDLLENWYAFASEHGQHAQKYMDRQAQIKFNPLLVKLAISWVSFICDDCDPTDQKTFRWAVNALEFTLSRTRGRSVLQLPNDQFLKLRNRVALCMNLLVSHFDVLGARSNLEAQKEKEKQDELIRTSKRQLEELELYKKLMESPSGDIILDVNEQTYWQRVNSALQELEQAHGPQRPLGRVLDNEKPEDRSLVFLASAGLNFSMRWQQRQFIGAGAFGSVYLAVNLETGSLMAVKEIKFQELAGVPNLYTQIKEELSIMEMVHHANVVEYYGIEVHRDKVYIFEEYCQGGSLAQLLEHGGGIEDERVLQVYTMQMLEGLSYLHSRGIVHRDVKPDNILLDHMGILKFADFGASKIFAKNHRTTHRSRRPMDFNQPHGLEALAAPRVMNSLTGTPMYMSPEMIKNDRRGRHGAMDLWSLGCVVLELATGKKPWSHLDNEWAIMFAIGSQQAIPNLPGPEQVGELCLDFIKQCFIIDPSARPTADELKDHPWMQEFRRALRDFEFEEMVDPPTVMPEEGEYENATVARQAAILQEKEVEEIHDNPLDPILEASSGSEGGSTPAEPDAEASN